MADDRFEDQELTGLLPEDIRDDASFTDIKTVGALGKSFINAQRLVGANKVALPGEKASDTEMDTFYASIGRPKVAGDYELQDVPEALGAPTETAKTVEWARGTFHKHGLTSRQAAGVFADYLEYSQGQIKALDDVLTADRTQSETALKTELGGAYDETVEIAGRGVMWAGDKALVELLDATGLGNHPAVIKAFAKVGKEIGEDTSEGGGRTPMKLTPAEAKHELEELNLDKEFQKALNTAEHPGHKDAVIRKQMLYDAAYPAEKT